jgi:prepilin-type N-terminal cleavage/methylation domain-containing protein
MRPSSACFRRNSAIGFTLLEMLVVLVIVAGTVGLVSVGFGATTTRASYRAAEQALITVLHGLPQEAAVHGRILRIDAAALRSRLDNWPEHWSLAVVPELQYGPTGQAAGGRVSLQMADGGVLQWRVEPVTGQAVRLP